MFSMSPLFHSFFPNMGIISMTALVFVQLLMILMFDCSFLMIQLRYFIVAHFIQVLQCQLNDERETKPTRRTLKFTTLNTEYGIQIY